MSQTQNELQTLRSNIDSAKQEFSDALASKAQDEDAFEKIIQFITSYRSAVIIKETACADELLAFEAKWGDKQLDEAGEAELKALKVLIGSSVVGGYKKLFNYVEEVYHTIISQREQAKQDFESRITVKTEEVLSLLSKDERDTSYGRVEQSWNDDFQERVDEMVKQERSDFLAVIADSEKYKTTLRNWLEYKQYDELEKFVEGAIDFYAKITELETLLYDAQQDAVASICNEAEQECQQAHMNRLSKCENEEDQTDAYTLLANATVKASELIDEKEYGTAWRIYKDAAFELEHGYAPEHMA